MEETPKVKKSVKKSVEKKEDTVSVPKKEKKEIPTIRQKGHPDAVAHMNKIRLLRKPKAPKEPKA